MSLGIGKFWALTRKWLVTSWFQPEKWLTQKKIMTSSEGELPVLEDYRKQAPSDFWVKFPFAPIPKETKTRIDRSALENIINRSTANWSHSKKVRSKRLMEDL